MGCPYRVAELDYWDGACNPIGDACNDCPEYDCEHNMNADEIDTYIMDAIRLDAIQHRSQKGDCAT